MSLPDQPTLIPDTQLQKTSVYSDASPERGMGPERGTSPERGTATSSPPNVQGIPVIAVNGHEIGNRETGLDTSTHHQLQSQSDLQSDLQSEWSQILRGLREGLATAETRFERDVLVQQAERRFGRLMKGKGKGKNMEKQRDGVLKNSRLGEMGMEKKFAATEGLGGGSGPRIDGCLKNGVACVHDTIYPVWPSPGRHSATLQSVWQSQDQQQDDMSTLEEYDAMIAELRSRITTIKQNSAASQGDVRKHWNLVDERRSSKEDDAMANGEAPQESSATASNNVEEDANMAAKREQWDSKMKMLEKQRDVIRTEMQRCVALDKLLGLHIELHEAWGILSGLSGELVGSRNGNGASSNSAFDDDEHNEEKMDPFHHRNGTSHTSGNDDKEMTEPLPLATIDEADEHGLATESDSVPDKRSPALHTHEPESEPALSCPKQVQQELEASKLQVQQLDSVLNVATEHILQMKSQVDNSLAGKHPSTVGAVAGNTKHPSLLGIGTLTNNARKRRLGFHVKKGGSSQVSGGEPEYSGRDRVDSAVAVENNNSKQTGKADRDSAEETLSPTERSVVEEFVPAVDGVATEHPGSASRSSTSDGPDGSKRAISPHSPTRFIPTDAPGIQIESELHYAPTEPNGSKVTGGSAPPPPPSGIGESSNTAANNRAFTETPHASLKDRVLKLAGKSKSLLHNKELASQTQHTRPKPTRCMSEVARGKQPVNREPAEVSSGHDRSRESEDQAPRPAPESRMAEYWRGNRRSSVGWPWFGSVNLGPIGPIGEKSRGRTRERERQTNSFTQQAQQQQQQSSGLSAFLPELPFEHTQKSQPVNPFTVMEQDARSSRTHTERLSHDESAESSKRSLEIGEPGPSSYSSGSGSKSNRRLTPITLVEETAESGSPGWISGFDWRDLVTTRGWDWEEDGEKEGEKDEHRDGEHGGNENGDKDAGQNENQNAEQVVGQNEDQHVDENGIPEETPIVERSRAVSRGGESITFSRNRSSEDIRAASTL